ncbi:putative guanyl-nucleotide exchange factor [Talaromyces proteolyticus]|uniref:Guanyl-nucleotide exchange factor n=1 Tax=Talaromyces proteolyticus TaxID=1131652 RepID=A0AAD4KQF3_9EURO|nr:putative guanyl-nucleotide exchange factor [Talaromyces proteolyticus]KAH8696047.1 putative guanyl-nucleotide exchange factor [Talaromyces proteolyticus]
MYWNRNRLAPTDANNNTGMKRYSFMLPTYTRHSEHVPRPAASPTPVDRRLSDSGPRPPMDESQPDGVHTLGPESHKNESLNGHHHLDESGAVNHAQSGSSAKRNRFSMLRFRHASDPQLSATYSQSETSIPPVPSMPPPPTIITTAPTTSSNLDKSARKTKTRFPLVKKLSKEALNLGNMSGSGNAKGPYSHALGGVPPIHYEEPGRLSTSSYRSGPTQRQSEHDNRLSESSRSEYSSGDRGSARSEVSHPNKKFSMLRLKRSRRPLFPLPVKLPPPGSDLSASGRQSPISNGDKMDLSQPDGDQISPLPSPTHSSVKLSSPKAISAPRLFRKNSTTSAASGKSASSAKGRVRRGRSSTLNSLIDAARSEDDPHNSSSNIPSGRNSTSTNGRKSFGDIFNLSNKLRQNPDLSAGRDGRASPKPPGTPGSDSKYASFAASRSMLSYPDRAEDDTPATYLVKLQETVPKGSIATILSKSDDDFSKVALRKFMRTFSFFGEPIDMAIRKLLMEVELPKETQQIDRVLQGFADRYYECNPGIFASTDQTYFIAFSILILHTDVFNKNNKRKMQKQDYVKNSRVDGISEDILECIYENISYTPFIHVEDELNLSTRQMPKRRALLKVASSDHLARGSNQPVDPYAVILDGALDNLRPSLKEVMDIDDSYSFPGVDGFKEIESLHQAFSNSAILQIVSARSRPDAFMTSTTIENPIDSHPGLVDIKVVKVGLLWRKDPKKKRARSPWQEWGALLTSSQLYFFRDLYWIKSLMTQQENQQKRTARTLLVFKPPVTEFKPDSIMSTSDAVALIDSAYKKHKHAFLFVRHNGLEEVFLANSDADMNDWLGKLNYAATFKTTGVPLKSTVGTHYEGRRHQKVTRMGSISSEESQPQSQAQMDVHSANKYYVDPHLVEEMSAARRQLMAQRVIEADEKLSGCQKQLDDLLRNARHLQILTPVNVRARENVILAAGRMSAKLKWVRYDIWRTKCYRQLLALDLGLEEKPSKDAQKHTSFATAKTSQASLARLDSVQSFSTAHQSIDGTSNGPTSQSPPDELTSTGLLASRLSSDGRRLSYTPSALSSEVHDDKQQKVGEASEKATTPSDAGQSKTTECEQSVLSSGREGEAGSLSSPKLKPTTSIPNVDEGEEQVLREAGLLGIDGPTGPSQTSALVDEIESNEKPTEEKNDAKSGDLRGRSRRSLQRTLRDSHRPSHQRSRKGRESSSSLPIVDSTASGEGEGLSRKDTNFTLHGKKASVITFGSEWQNISPEERLQLRKSAVSEELRASESGGDAHESTRSASIHSARPQSIRSASTATARSSRLVDSVSVAGDIPEIPSLDVLKKEQAGSSSTQNKSNEIVTSTTSTKVSDVINEDVNGRENGDFVDQISVPEGPKHSPHEQAVGA